MNKSNTNEEPEPADWVKHDEARLWCSVLPVDSKTGSIHTRCRGRFSKSEPHAFKVRPLVADRCPFCQSSYAASQLDELAKRCGDASQKHAIQIGLLELRRLPSEAHEPCDNKACEICAERQAKACREFWQKSQRALEKIAQR